MNGSRILNQLLSRWEAGLHQGSEETPEELCRDRPELLPELRRQIEALRAFQSLARTRIEAANTLAYERGGASGPFPQVEGYAIEQELGRGGMGVVYRARHLRLKRTVALKMIVGGLHLGSGQRARFVREAEAIARVQHPNIVQIFELGEQGPAPYLALEYVEGGSLDQRLAGQPLPARVAATLVRDLARAVHAAHQAGVVHRDLKPGNVLLTGDGVPKVTDFGLAKQPQLDPDDPHRTLDGSVVGTPSYMAPEQAMGRLDQVGPPADVYALGAILYEALTGRPPFKGTTVMETLQQVVAEEPCPPSRLQGKVPRDLETIVLKCLHKAPAGRYASAAELADDLGRFLDGLPIRARPVGAVGAAWRWCRRKPAIAALAVGLVLAVSAGVAGVVWQWRRAEDRAEAARQGWEQAQVNARDALEQKRLAEEREATARETLKASLLSISFGRKVVDTFLTRVSESPELKASGMEDVRKRLLTDAAGFYDVLIDKVPAWTPAMAEDHGLAHLRLAEIEEQVGSLSVAITKTTRAAAVFADLARRWPGHRGIGGHRADVQERLGRLLTAAGRYPEAERALAEAVRLADELLAHTPGKADLLYRKARFLSERGRLEWRRGRGKEADAFWEQACGLLEPLAAADPERFEYRNELAHALSNQGVRAWEEKRTADAIARLDRALQVREPLLARHPDSAAALTGLADVCNNLGAAHRQAGRPDRAEAAWNRCREVRRQLARAHPLVTEYQVELASAHGNLGRLYAETRRPAEAERAYRTALESYEELLRASEVSLDCRDSTARVAVNLGELLSEQNRFADALPCYTRAIAGLEPFRKDLGAHRTAAVLLAKAGVGRAEALTCLGRHREAAEAWEKAESDVPVSNRPLVRLRRATELACAGDHAPAARLVRATMANDAGTDGSVPYQAAMALTCAAGAAQADGTLSAADRTARGKEHLDEAFRLLAQPVARAFLQQSGRLRQIGTLADWGPLRAHPGYPAFVAAMNGSPASR